MTRIIILLTLLFFYFPWVYSATFFVSNVTDAGSGSLRQALNDANATMGPDSIRFSVAGVIDVVTQLPALIDEVVIDGTSAPGYVNCGAPTVALNFVGTGGAHGLLILNGGNGSTVKALNIRGFTAAGISSEFSSNITISRCFIGTDSSGTSAMGNNLGIILVGSPDCIIGGLACEGNVVSGNLANGIAMENGCHRTLVSANLVGIGHDKTTLLGNGLEGIYAYNSTHLKIGLSSGELGNIVTGNAAQGIHLNGDGLGCDSTEIYNNYIGTTGTMSVGYGNLLNGIFLEGGTSDVTIGGLDDSEANYIADNGLNGIQINEECHYNSMLGNSISCNTDQGIYLDSANGNLPILPELVSRGDSLYGSGGTPGNIVHAYRNLAVSEGEDSLLCACEGENYIGLDTIDSLGNWLILHNLGLSAIDQGSITATQTDSMNNTSEFYAPCVAGTPVGIATLEETKMVVYPNPSQENFQIDLSTAGSTIKRLVITDILGKIVFTENVFPTPIRKVNTSSWKPGIYLVRLETTDIVTTLKVLLQ